MKFVLIDKGSVSEKRHFKNAKELVQYFNDNYPQKEKFKSSRDCYHYANACRENLELHTLTDCPPCYL